MTTAEKNQFYDKYIKTMHVDISPQRGSNDRAWKIVPILEREALTLSFYFCLNQQFNDNFKKQGYHDINDKNKE